MSNVIEPWMRRSSSGELFIRMGLYIHTHAETSLKDLWSAYKDWWTTNKGSYPWAKAMALSQFTTALTNEYGKPADGVTFKRVSTWDWEAEDEEDEEAEGT